MQASKSWKEETAKEIIYEFEELLNNNDLRINNNNSEDNQFESSQSRINIKDYGKLKKEIMRQLDDFEEYLNYYKYESVA